MTWKPISEAPRNEFGCIEFESGTILRAADDSLLLLGDNVAGDRTRDCNCCSDRWDDLINAYDGRLHAYHGERGRHPAIG